jgi:AAA+ superfamily predicted ATPase
MANDVTHVTIGIQRSANDVYDFLSVPQNFPKWAPGFCLSIEETNTDNTWKIQTSNGEAHVAFVEKNKLGVVDHYVTMNSITVYVPLRVIARGSGSIVVFTLFQQPGMSDSDFEGDRAAVEKDLQQLKSLLEK